MKIICPNCNKPNALQQKECFSCQSQLNMSFDSHFQTEKGTNVSFLELFSKVDQLEQRLTFVEENYEQKSVQKEPVKVVEPIKEVIVPEQKSEQQTGYVSPEQLPNTLEGLRVLLIKAEEAKAAAFSASDMALHAELSFECKRIERRIQRLEEYAEPQKDIKVEPVVESNKSYPTTIDALKTLLIKTLAEKQKANAANDLKALEVCLEEEKNIKNRIRNLELASQYGKDSEENNEKQEEPQEVVEIPKTESNKQFVFEIEQELATVWKAKQKATLEQNIVRLALLSDKEKALKEELVLAQNGVLAERQNRISTEEHVEEKTTVVSNKTITQPKEVVKKVKAEPQGPTATEQFFAPLINGIAFIEQRYNQYKEEGKLPLFFLTIAGIVTLLFGFGFLAQYSAVTYFGDYLTQIKVGFGFVCSSVAIGIGIKLIGKKADFASFGEALMGLGLSLNYLFIYFLSAEPALINSTVGFILIFVNTAVSVGFSLKFNSKIIAVLALLGGAFAPSYLQSNGENTHIYFFYLWLLCAASAFVAYRIKWEILNFISFLVATLILGTSVYFNYTDVRTLSDNLYLLLFHAFAYLYAYLSLFDGTKPKSEPSPMSLITIVGAQVAMMMSLYYVFGIQQGSYERLAMAYVLNMLPFAAITFIYWSHWSERQKALLIGFCGVFLAAAIAAYIGVAYRGMLWALEGIMLLAGGLIFKLALVRRIAYSIILMGIINMLANLGWNDMPDRVAGVLFTAGYINLWSLGILLLVISVLFKKYEDNLEHHEKNVPLVFNELIAVWGIFVFYITTYFFFGKYAYNLALIPMVVLLLWNNYRKLQLAEILGIGQLLVLVGLLFNSTNLAQSWHFTDLALYGQLAIIEIMVVLWGLKTFYEKVLPNAAEYKHQLAARARELSYFIFPLALLDSFYNGLPEYILYGLWGTVFLTFVLCEISASKLVLAEFLILTVAAMGVSFIEVQYGPLLLGNALLLGVLFYKKAWKEEAFKVKDYQPVYLIAPYFAIASVGLVVFKATNEDLISALFVIGGLLLTMVNLAHQLAPIKRTLHIAYRVAWLATAVALVLTGLLVEIDVIKPTIILGLVFLVITLGWSHKMIYKADIPYNGNRKSIVWIGESIFLHVLNIASYTTVLFYLTKDIGSLWLTIALFIHGIALVFNGLLPNYKQLTNVYIAIFVFSLAKLFLMDMKDAETIMKIIVFIVVGIICLVAAFALIKYNDKNKTNNVLVEEENDSSEEDDKME